MQHRNEECRAFLCTVKEISLINLIRSYLGGRWQTLIHTTTILVRKIPVEIRAGVCLCDYDKSAAICEHHTSIKRIDRHFVGMDRILYEMNHCKKYDGKKTS